MSSTIAIKKPSIVVVDDEHDLVELFSEILRSNGYDVHAFTDPIEDFFIAVVDNILQLYK